MIALALLLAHAAAMPAADIAELPPRAFFEAVRELRWNGELSRSPDRLWPVLTRCLKELPGVAEGDPDAFEKAYACGEVGQRLAWSGDSDDRSSLWDVYDALPDDIVLKQSLLNGFLAARLAEAVEDLDAGRAETADLADAEAAGRLYDSVEHEYAEAYATLQADGAVEVQSHWPDFHAAVADFLRGRSSAEQARQRVGRFGWGGMCGHGADLLYDPQHATLMLAYLAEGRTDLAAGALLRIGDQATWSEAAPGWERRVLDAAGLDWETLYVGALLEGRATAEALGRRGSERAARLLLAVRDRSRSPFDDTPLGDDERFLSALAAFVRPGQGCTAYGTSSSLDLTRDVPVRITPELELQILEALAEKVRPDQGEGPADAASHILVRLCRPESRGAFRVMTDSPFAEVRRRGVIGLESLGEPAPRVAGPRPVAFRITVDGRPLAGVEVGWEVVQGEGQSRSSTARSDGSGVVKIERDPFVDPKRPVKTWAFEARELARPGDVWFAVGGPTPQGLDALTRVEVATQSLSLVLGPARGPVTVTLQATSSRWGMDEFPHAISKELRAEPGSTLVFPRLQRGREYRLEVVRADGTRWGSEGIALGDEPVVVEVAAASSR